ncbi:MAG: Coenzyme F420 hydrogenase/dehydrogenase, beta subunit C-terminal domain [Thermoplasmatota archaeon]
MGSTGYGDLRSQVIESGLCVRCGGCAASCPEEVLVYGDGGIELSGECVNCGTCLRICPGRKIDFSGHEIRLFGRSRKRPIGRRLGLLRTRVNLRASDRAVLKAGYNGGRIGAILIHAIGKGLIDSALMTDWSGGKTLSVGRAEIARSREDVLRLTSTKYVHSPVLTLLKDITQDPSIESTALIGLPCHISAFRNMENDPVASRFTGKVRYALGLHCGNGILIEEDFRRVVSQMTGIPPDDIREFRAWKVKGNLVRFRVTRSDGHIVESDHKSVIYMKNIMKSRTWPPCSMCIDYAADLADVSFGWPQTRSEKGEELLRTALREGSLKKGTRKRMLAQIGLDLVGSGRKRRSSRREIGRRKREALPYPEYL